LALSVEDERRRRCDGTEEEEETGKGDGY